MFKQKSYDIFLSYHKHQSNEVFKFYRALRNTNMRCWLDQVGSKRSQSAYDESMSAIRDSQLFMFFDTQKFRNSLQCRVELAIALEQNMPIANITLLKPIDLDDESSSSCDSSPPPPQTADSYPALSYKNTCFEEFDSRNLANARRYLKIELGFNEINDLVSNKASEHKLKEILDRINDALVS